jgi:hypothetical protein
VMGISLETHLMPNSCLHIYGFVTVTCALHLPSFTFGKTEGTRGEFVSDQISSASEIGCLLNSI